MTDDRKSVDRELRRHLSLFGSPSAAQMEASRARIRERLRAGDAERVVRDERPALPASRVWVTSRTLLPLAAAMIIAVLVVASPWRTEWLATVEAADGSHYTLKPHVVLRASAPQGTMLTLKDGSTVEMRSQSELSLERTSDGIGIRLANGAVIVNSTTPGNGHLYVHTKDLTVAVAHTTMVVNAETSGSRVTVLEGEVRVRDKATETTLRPGEQVSTSTTLAMHAVKDEVSWSRHADVILAAFTKGMSATAGAIGPFATTPEAFGAAIGRTAVPEFEAASIKQCDPDHLPPQPNGGRGGGVNSFQLTPGRVRALCMTPATLVRTAYGYSPLELDVTPDASRPWGTMNIGDVYGLGVEDGRRVRSGPEWTRSERYTVEAVATAGSTPDAQTLRGPMLRRLLERRFQLQAHIETEQVPAFALTVAKGGLKITPVTAGACDELPARDGSTFRYGHPMSVMTPPRTLDDVRRGLKPSCGVWGRRNGPNQVLIGGDVPLQSLLQMLGMQIGARIVDRTGVADRFNFVLEFVLDEHTRKSAFEIPDPRADLDVSPAATIFSALEEQLGVTLQADRAPREFVVVDHIERPSPN